MSTQPLSSRFHLSLPTRSIFAVPDGAGVGIECRSGSVWVTLDRDPRDIVLAPGERFEGSEHRRMLVSALEASCITVSDAQPAAMPLPPPVRRRSPWRLLPLGLSPA
ncbi:DUF2917 domain-containing protein [Variovorax beijingensis]|uniref:DUF2917 domain-containing protein n=1 Tax=Variovorax beijingensis TaxID=2496117 RepID=A0A3P3ESB6_9BURK|nr:DUF2917 domain-containing protein [Variovorax beijingensis]RRH89161.1 DUF2917 domain-containing protein [Variovorax beijingensis]RSZ36467.1 DUF2917 domain-containing protein [Variovorax beijingensis]